jgi:hypothetical protein
MSGERLGGFASEVYARDDEKERSEEYSFDSFSCYTGGSLTSSVFGASPELLTKNPDLAKDDVTGFKFVFGRGGTRNSETVEAAKEMGFSADVAEAVGTSRDEFKSVYVFVGEITDYDAIKDLFEGDVNEEDKKRKYVVSKDAQGEIIDARPILKDEEVHVVPNKKELFKLYEDVTGYSYPEKGE